MADIKKLIEQLSVEVVPVKASAHPFLTLVKWSGMAILYLAVLILCAGVRDDVALKFHAPLFLAEINLLICMIFTSALSIALLSFPDVYQKRWVAYLPMLPMCVFCTVLVLEYIGDVPPSPKPAHGLECLICITFYSVIPACWIFYRLRKMASTHVELAGCVALLGASSIGCLALRLSEQTDSVTHLIQWHYLPMLVFSLFGIWLGKKFLKW